MNAAIQIVSCEGCKVLMNLNTGTLCCNAEGCKFQGVLYSPSVVILEPLPPAKVHPPFRSKEDLASLAAHHSGD